MSFISDKIGMVKPNMKSVSLAVESQKAKSVPAFLANSAAYLLAGSNITAAKDRAAVLRAAAHGDLSEAMDAMMNWAISERRNRAG